jgi:hypothetical protein
MVPEIKGSSESAAATLPITAGTTETVLTAHLFLQKFKQKRSQCGVSVKKVLGAEGLEPTTSIV